MKKQNGITLIALVISIIVMLILAGVSINAIVGENGVLTKAQNAKLTSEEAARLEELELILFEYNSSEFLGESDGFAAFLADKKADGTIQDYIYLDNLIIKYKDKYYEAETDGEYYSVSGQMEDDLTTGGGVSNDYIITPDNLTNNMEFEGGNSYVVLDKVSGEDFNFEIPAGDPVTIKLVGDMSIDNKGYKRSAIDLEEGATLNLHVYGNVTVNSGLGEDASGDVPGKGGYAGIHVPEGATLNLYGTGVITAIGGDAGDGAIAGGGGAGAGIGGKGGDGAGFLQGTDSVDIAYKAPSGGAGENCGNINIYNEITVYAYGGAGGSGGKSSDGGAGSGGYPSAGIGGGGASGAGSTCCTGAGGYSGGNGSNRVFSVAISQNGLNGCGFNGSEVTDFNSVGLWGSGGGYYKGSLAVTQNGDLTNIYGGMSGSAWWTGHQAGNGGAGGKGGIVKVSENAKVYAFNGNRFTDGTDYNNGENEAVIYYQNGINIERGYTTKSVEGGINDSESYAIFHQTNAQSTVDKSGYVNHYFDDKTSIKIVTINDLLTNVDLSYQGVGSGAGYIELSNGTYTVDSSMN